MYLFFISIFISSGFAFTTIRIEPKAEFHDKTKSLIITCNATKIGENNLDMYYEHDKKNYSIPRIKQTNPSVFVGNLSIFDSNLFKVNVLCVNYISKTFISSKIYFFGYSPSMVLQGDSKPNLKCQDFNLKRAICCLTPNENQIITKTGFVEEDSAHLNISLYNLAYGTEESRFNNSCFNVTQMTFSPNLRFQLNITNDIGGIAVNFTIDRMEILKPQNPIFYLKARNETSFQAIVSMIDDGEFIVRGYCISTFPINMNQTFGRIVTRSMNKFIMSKWKPNSNVNCKVDCQVLFGSTGKGKFSDESFANVQLPETKPNSGPMVSPAFTSYGASNSGYLEDVAVYFIDLPIGDQNGRIIQYHWLCTDCIHGRRDVSNENQAIESDVRSVSLNKARIGSSFLITACTNVGCSDTWKKFQFTELKDKILKKRIVLSRNVDNRKFVNVSWYMENKSSTNNYLSPHLIVCFKSTNQTNEKIDDCTSTQLINLGTELTGKKKLEINDYNIGKFALLSISKNGVFSQMEWDYCINDFLPITDVMRNLREFDFQKFLNIQTNCDLSDCISYITVDIPSCKEIPSVEFPELLLSYDSSTGRRNISKLLNASSNVTFQLMNLTHRTSYELMIFDVVRNQSLFWFRTSFKTYWLSLSIVIMMAFAAVILLLIAFFIFWWKFQKIRMVYFKKEYQKATHNSTVTRNDSVQPLTLNNADDGMVNYVTSEKNNAYQIVQNSPVLNDSTDSTNLCITDSFDDSTNSSTESPTDISNIPDGSYKNRPDQQPKPVDPYISLVVPADKAVDKLVIEPVIFSNGVYNEMRV